MSIIPNICNAIRSVTLTRTRFNKAINHLLTTRRRPVEAEFGWMESGTSEGPAGSRQLAFAVVLVDSEGGMGGRKRFLPALPFAGFPRSHRQLNSQAVGRPAAG